MTIGTSSPLQQVSTHGAKYETYSPYIEELVAYVKKYCPHAKILIHQTWAYEENNERLRELCEFATSKDVLTAVCNAYDKAAELIAADGIIPCGRAMIQALELGIQKIHRDTFICRCEAVAKAKNPRKKVKKVLLFEKI